MSDTRATPTTKPGAFELVEREFVSATDAEKTLLARPRKSIRRQLAIMFALFAIGSLAITAVIGILLTVIERKIHLIGVADQLNYEIFQARRFEKNYLLYGSDLEHVDYHIDAAHVSLEQSLGELRVAVSTECLEFLEVNLWHYRELIGKLRKLDQSDEPAVVQARTEVQQQLRETGSNLVTCGQKIASTERESVDRWLTVSRLFPAVYLFLVVALSAYAASFMRRDLMRRLELLMAAARRIGAGDFSPIVPVRKSRDELTDLAIAINRMTHELERRQEFLLQSQKLRAVGSLTAGIAHELNNPINNIMLTAAVLDEDLESMPDSEKRELIEDIEEQSDRARRIVRNLLDFARESEISTERLKIQGVVGTAVGLTANQLKLSGIRLVRDIPDDLPEIVGDPQYLSQVFLNIILNAVDAMDGGGTLSLTGRVSSEDGFLAVDISDTGPGMSPQVLNAIFDPFFTTKSRGGGTGLGLSVSLGIVQKHGGDIKVRSKLGDGSTFTVILPLAPSDQTDSPPHPERRGP
jgi:two-component system NtrC family sensor kinase